MFLGEIKQPVTRIKGVGPRVSSQLAQLGIQSVADLLYHFPRNWEDRLTPRPLREALPEGSANTQARVIAHDWFGRPPRQTLKVHIDDGTARAALLCFGRNFLADKLPVGADIRIFGQFQQKFHELQASSFEFERLPPPESPGSIPAAPLSEPPSPEESLLPPSPFGIILPVYPLTEGLTQNKLRRLMAEALEHYGRGLSEELPPSLIKQKNFLSQEEALRALHFPRTLAERDEALRRLIYQELFHLELMIARKAYEERQGGKTAGRASQNRHLPRRLQKELEESLPFSLTPDQLKAVEEITADLERPRPMNRLIQGDVGCGKTLVAFLSALPLIEAGEQAALMAPTELLARQHAQKAADLLGPLGVRVAFFTGQVTGEPRRLLLEQLRRGEIDLLVGTHALFSREVTFRNLALVMVDEQHRFGVAQRKALAAKGISPDLLMMTATPIPRSLALTAYGNLDITAIRTMPAGRRPVKTHLIPPEKTEAMYGFIAGEMEKGHQAYFVYPLIEEGESDLKNAIAMYRRLSEKVFTRFRGGLIHSRLKAEEKQETMEAFARGELQFLTATSVVEVGVDVAAATVMVVEHAERFGLSALHQLRGRVGRSTLESWAFLVHSPAVSPEGQQRLLVMRNHHDGFRIAEEDLRIRGPGELTGSRQSGYLQLRLASITENMDVLKEARREAFHLIADDPGLLKPDNENLRRLLEAAPPFTDTLTGSH